jgi:FkbM family methyltransferase
MISSSIKKLEDKTTREILAYINHLLEINLLIYIRKIFRRMKLVGATEIKSEQSGVSRLVLNKTSILGFKRSTIWLPKDEVIFKSVLNYGYWEPLESKFLAEIINTKPSNYYEILDIGANIGLVSLQTLNSINKLTSINTYEPLGIHNFCLRKNLSNHPNLSSLTCEEFALGSKNESAMIYTDLTNKGNSSLSIDSMFGAEYTTEIISIRDTNSVMYQFMDRTKIKRYLVKMDIQGSELDVLSRLPATFYQKTDGMVIEISSDSKVDSRTVDKILKNWAIFTNIRFNHPNAKRISVNRVREIWNESTGKQRNLFLSRD